jgi:heat shock protein HslJ
MQIITRFVFLIILLLSGCAANTDQQPVVTDETGAACPLPLPATWSATIPCTNCPPTSASLTLRPDQLYFLRVVTRDPDKGTEKILAEIGAWKYVSQGEVILLTTYDNAARTLHILPDNSLRAVKVSGGIIPPSVNYDLRIDEGNPGYNDVVHMRGMYVFSGKTGIFTECLSGASFTVVRKKENAALERAYMNTPHGQGEPLLVDLDARLVLQPRYGSIGYEDAVVPEKFIDIRPGIECSGEKSSRLRLVDNSWRLIEMHGKKLVLPDGVKNPFMALYTKGNRMNGFSGCNRFNGTYLVKGDVFLFNKLFVRRMACVGGMDIEDEFYRILSATDSYRIKDDILELLDTKNSVVARFKHAGGV